VNRRLFKSCSQFDHLTLVVRCVLLYIANSSPVACRATRVN